MILLVCMKLSMGMVGFHRLSLMISCILIKYDYMVLPFWYFSLLAQMIKLMAECLAKLIVYSWRNMSGGWMTAVRLHLLSFHSKELLQHLIMGIVDILLKIMVDSIIMSINYNHQSHSTPYLSSYFPSHLLIRSVFFHTILVMGASQQRPCELWITIERFSRTISGEILDLTKERIIVSSSKAYFPSYFHFYQHSRTITYSLLQDKQNQHAVLDFSKKENRELQLRMAREYSNRKVWRLLRQDEDVLLQEGSCIKLGELQVQLKELLITNTKKSMKNLLIQFEPVEPSNAPLPVQLAPSLVSSRFLKNSDIMSRLAYSRMKDSDIISLVPSDYNLKKSMHTERSNQPICRFCFDGTSHKNNPLFNVCQCLGSVKLIHYLCLKNWIRSKMGKVETSHCVYYHYQPLICELCKHHFSNQIKHNGRTYSLFEPEKIHPPYARFEHFQDNKIFQILVRLEQSSVIDIGRGKENQLNLNQPTVNRSHASLFYTNKQLFFKSKPSKHGTYVQLTQAIQLTSYNPIQLLIQNHLVTFERRAVEKGMFENQCCTTESPISFALK